MTGTGAAAWKRYVDGPGGIRVPFREVGLHPSEDASGRVDNAPVRL